MKLKDAEIVHQRKKAAKNLCFDHPRSAQDSLGKPQLCKVKNPKTDLQFSDSNKAECLHSITERNDQYGSAQDYLGKH